MEKKFEQLLQKLNAIAHIYSAQAVLSWDRETSIPPQGVARRAETIAYLSGLAHELCLDPQFEEILTELHTAYQENKLTDEQSVVVKEVWRDFNYAKKLPTSLIKEFSETCAKAHSSWAEAREKNDFSIFSPDLKKIVELNRKKAELIGYKESPYDARLDVFEPGMTASELSILFHELKEFLVPFLKKIQEKNATIDVEKIKGHFPIEKQKEFNKFIAEKLGFNFNAGCLEVSTHPFTTHFHPEDVRMTTRYKETDLLEAITGTIHETGHALYEQGLPQQHFGTPLAEAVSLGIHESQSRMWENHVGKSYEFWEFLYPEMQTRFPEPFKNIPLDEFYKILNNVAPGYIRIESDEVTYNLHIILRFEIEKMIFEGECEVDDLPEIWNQKFKEYFGIDVPDNAHGVLQDVHWSYGSFGYFPTYTLGNLYAAQMYHHAQTQLLSLADELRAGKTEPLLNWLRKNVHQHGKKYSAGELIKEITGEPLQSTYFIDYLKKKFGDIYRI